MNEKAIKSRHLRRLPSRVACGSWTSSATARVRLETLACEPAGGHLRVLREAHLVDAEVHAQQRLYGLRAEPLRVLNVWDENG